ncbi:MAG TPA: FKBP-type peptidyl-prolyl cis-trans isomerase [Rhodothermales bacterium]|nr:FKBP-type peptidyl-prolyl cis-trans isomerase [Rhodothermales bacterium]
MRSFRRLLPLLALPLVIVACDSNDDEDDKRCYSRSSSGQACFEVTESVVGTGATPDRARADSVFVRYVGRIQGSAEFDRGAFGFRLREGEVIPGFLYGVGGYTFDDGTTVAPMKVGGKRLVKIPAELAYGEREIRNQQGFVVIPRNSDLEFDIELTGVKPRTTSN